VGDDLAARRVPAVWRIHGPPDARKLAQLSNVAESLGHALDPEAAANPKVLQEFLARLEGTAHAQPLGYLLLRSMQQASYSLDNIGHFALASRAYVHFTSPIRRYPDVTVHRVVRALLRHERIDDDALRRRMRPEAVAASRMERRAMTVERDAQAIHKAIVMRAFVGQTMRGRVSGVADDRLSVSLESPFVEVKVPVDRMGGTSPGKPSRWELDALGTRFVERKSGRSLGLGDAVAIRIDEASIERREILGSIVGAEAARGGAPKGKKEHARSSKPKHSAKPNPVRPQRGRR
jgi:ribonuclease R